MNQVRTPGTSRIKIAELLPQIEYAQFLGQARNGSEFISHPECEGVHAFPCLRGRLSARVQGV